jgi:hypothetical protein
VTPGRRRAFAELERIASTRHESAWTRWGFFDHLPGVSFVTHSLVMCVPAVCIRTPNDAASCASFDPSVATAQATPVQVEMFLAERVVYPDGRRRWRYSVAERQAAA